MAPDDQGLGDARPAAEEIAKDFGADAPAGRDCTLKGAIDNLADQLCVAVDGDFDFLVRSPIEDDSLEKLAMLVNLVVDTARRGMGALRDNNTALAELEMAKSVFFSNASHELRTPLTLLLGPIEDALARPGGTLGGEPLQTAHRNALRLRKLVNDLLDFSRIEAGRMEAHLRPVDLAALTVGIASLFRPSIESARLRFRVDCPALPTPVQVDPDMWERIVANLLSNAFKFTMDGEITLRLSAASDAVVLEVTDTGTGIPADRLGRLFERFHRIEGAAARTSEGSGIGLAMVHELAKLHRGHVEVESREGEGSVFRVVVPLVADAGAKEPTALPAERTTRASLGEMRGWSSRAPEGDDAPPATGRDRVIVADDNADMRAYLTRLLGPYWPVQACRDGQEALEAARADPPGLVVCDVMMPRLDGFGLLRALRSHEATHAIPVILLSARADATAMEDGLELGTDDYMVKPFSSRELVARVRSRLELSHLRAELIEKERHAREVADNASSSKDRFLAMLAHELRNPLAPIMTAVHVMEMKGGESTRKEREIIRRQLTHINHLVDDLLDVSRVMRGNVTLYLERHRLVDAVAKAVETVHPQLESRLHELAIDVPEDLVVEADATRLTQILSNIIANAAKYTDPRGRIEVFGRGEGDQIFLHVRDNGIGIDPASLANVFEPYMQVEQARNRAVGGLGLGLAIVKSLVEQHGGSVEARSAGLNQGTEFIVRFPVPRGVQATAGTCASGDPSDGNTPRRVLIVEDNDDAAASLAAGLRMLGHEVALAEDGPGGLRQACEFQPDIALLDLGLPGMDGYELARRIREVANVSPHLVALSGYGEAADIERGRQAGFHAHLVKPVALEVIAATIERLCSERTMARPGESLASH